MFALQFDEYGGPEVLHVAEAEEPHAGPGQVRIAVAAASVNPFDWKLRAGYLAEMVPLELPSIPGTDAAGVVDEVGEGVEGIALGDRVFGLGERTSAQYAVLDHAVVRPDSMSWEEAAGLGLAVEAAARSLARVDLPEGATIVIDGAAGGTGTAMTQLAVGRGHTVVGTASEGNHAYLRSMGALPTTYGPGLVERVAGLAPHVDGAFDLAGDAVDDLIAITGDPARVATLVDFSRYGSPVHVVDTSMGRQYQALGEAVALREQGRFTMPVQQVFPLAQAGDAHALSAGGHVRGKVVLTVP
ncbi:NADP-dependent oxidoreductase [Oryzobacter telluris]|uniref:NADP-dependent oxidoreductase n=1 Tax=Oryzobacter telluris TaxID=3149179 RepID=UPI00370D3D6A